MKDIKNLDGRFVTKEDFEEIKEMYKTAYFGENEDDTETYAVYLEDGEEIEVYVY